MRAASEREKARAGEKSDREWVRKMREREKKRAKQRRRVQERRKGQGERDCEIRSL